MESMKQRGINNSFRLSCKRRGFTLKLDFRSLYLTGNELYNFCIHTDPIQKERSEIKKKDRRTS